MGVFLYLKHNERVFRRMALPVVTVVCGILEDGEGRLLLAQRPADKVMPFFWEFPGGKLEEGENPEEALARELLEEIGIKVSLNQLTPLTFVSLPYSDFHIILLCYQCHEWSGIPKALEGQGGLEWFCPKDLENYPMREANRAVLPLLQNGADSNRINASMP